ncbi:hypothetical protein ABZ839_25370 [Streptomyces cellulosae]
MDSIVHAPVEDELFGAVEIELDHEGGTLRVSGGELPTVEIRGGPDTSEVETHVRFGGRSGCGCAAWRGAW